MNEPNVVSFHGTSGPRDADIMIVGESWGEQEDRRKLPFVGQSGDELTKILSEAGIPRNKVFFSNVISQRPPRNDMSLFFNDTKTARKDNEPFIRGLYPKQNIIDGVARLREQIEIVKPKIIIGFGNYTLWALTEDCFKVGDKAGRKVPTGIGNWRGSQLYCREDMGGCSFLPTYHPAAAMRQWAWRYDIVHDLKARVPKALKKEWSPPDYNFIIRPSFNKVMETFHIISKLAEDEPCWIAEDIETRADHITCIGFAWSATDAICIPFTCAYGAFWTLEEEQEIILAIRRLHANTNVKTIGMNFLFDSQYIARYWGYIPRCEADVMIKHHVCWPGKPKSLNYISSLYNNYHRFWKDEGKEFHTTFSDDQHWNYNCKDACATYEANFHLDFVIDALGIKPQAALQMEQFEVVLDMMIRRVRIDLKARARLSVELAELITNRCEWLEGILPHDVYPRKPKKSPWYSSSQQTAEVFYDELGLKEIKAKGKRAAKGRTCNDDALTTIGNREPILRPITEAIQELRSLRIFRTNFVEAVLDEDERLGCSFDITGTRTFRWNSSESAFHRGTNLQTIPKGSEE